MSFAAWSYKQTHSITHGTGLTDYQVQFIVYKTSGTSSGSSIYCNTHCNDDFSDIRFSVDDTTSLPYWIESYTSGVSAAIWVKLPTIDTTTITVFYGNVIATSESNGDATFVFFDDFSSGTLDTVTKWTNTGTASITAGILTWYGATGWKYLQTQATFGLNTSVRSKFQFRARNAATGSLFGYRTSQGGDLVQAMYYGSASDSDFRAIKSGGTTQTNDTNTSAVEHIYHIYRTSTPTCKFTIDDVTATGSPLTTSTAIPTISLAVSWECNAATAYGVKVDWVAVLNCAATEPTQGSWGGEIYIGGTGVFISANPSSGTPPLTTSISVSSGPLTNFELLFGDGQSYNVPDINYDVFLRSWTTNGATFNGCSFRNVISSANILASANNIRIKIVFPSSGTLILTHVAIVERDGSTANGTTIPTEVTFNDGSSGVTVTTSDVYSDWISYTIDPSKDYLIILDISDTSTASCRLYTGSSYYKVAASSWDTQSLASPINTYTYGNSAFAIESHNSNTIQESFTTTHTYDTFGTYQVYASGYIGTTLCEDYAAVIVSNNSLTASFTKVQTLNVVSFTDTSTGSPNEWFWDFGDGSTSQLQNPTHTYQAPGTYTVTLYASNQEYNGYTTSSLTIANPTPGASITVHQYDNLIVPCHLSFIPTTTVNASLNERIISYSWALNGTAWSSAIEPTKYFVDYGSQIVGLTVTNNYGVTFATTSTTTLGAIPIANFKPSLYNIISPVLPYEVDFTNLSWPTDIPSTTYLWNFGDTSTSTSYNPSHAFATYGNYDVALTITNPYGSDTVTYNDAIRMTQKSKSFTEITAYADTFSSFEIEVFNEFASATDLTIIYATILPEAFNIVQREVPDVPGVDEWGIPNLYRTLNIIGSKIYSTFNEWGHHILRVATFSDQTGLILYHTKEFEETITFIDDHEYNNPP